MGASKKLKKVMVDKGVTQVQLAEMLNKPFNTVRNIIANDNCTMKSLEEMANVLDCDVALIDRKTGEIYR